MALPSGRVTFEPRVRRIDASEWRELRSLRLQALRDAPRAFGSTYEREAAFSDERWQAIAASGAAGVDDVAVVATVDSSWVAMARGYLARDEPSASRVAWLIAVYVDPRWRGRGLGRAVSAGVVDWARERGASEVRLHVGDWNNPARRVYEELGFTPTGAAKTLAHDPSVPESEMRLRLDP
jgi:GNAT superfamily N-acetyltransferase